MYTYDYDFSFSPSMPVVTVEMTTIALRIGPHFFPYVRVAADKHNGLIVLGRDVLNQMRVTLNGLATTTEIYE